MASSEVRTAGPSLRRRARIVGARPFELLDARELLWQLVRKELKVRYRASALGFLWSLLTPALMTVVFSVVFTRVVRIGVEDFAAFFLVAYLPWQFLQNSSQGSLHSIVGNADLVKKVYFPREVLPLSHVLAQLAHYLLAIVAVLPYLVAVRGVSVLTHLPALLVVVALLAVFVAGVAMWFAAVNVTLRDVQELFVVLFLLWFYASPVLYPSALVEAELGSSVLVRLLSLNPMAWFVPALRAPLYGVVSAVDGTLVATGPSWPSPALLGGAAAWALASLTLGYAYFLRRARSFAREV